MGSMVLTSRSLNELNVLGVKYEFAGSFASRCIHEDEGVNEVIASEVRKRKCHGLTEIQRESVATYKDEGGFLVSNGISYIVRGRLIRRIY